MPLFMPPDGQSDNDLQHFLAIPWCKALIQNPIYKTHPTASRTVKADTEDALIGGTLKTTETISACLSLFKIPSPTDERIPEVNALLTLGPGLNGHPDICHGGIVATILDEVMGVLQMINKDRDEDIAAAKGVKIDRPAEFTAELKIGYKRPVRTPQTVCVTCWYSRVEGKKFWMAGAIKDAEGNVLATGESLFIRVPRSRL